MIQHLFACFGASVAYNSNVAWMRCISLQKRIQRKKLKLHTFWMQNVLLIFFIINETSFRVFFAGYFEKHLHFILFYATMTQCIYWFLYFLIMVILSDFCIFSKVISNRQFICNNWPLNRPDATYYKKFEPWSILLVWKWVDT